MPGVLSKNVSTISGPYYDGCGMPGPSTVIPIWASNFRLRLVFGHPPNTTLRSSGLWKKDWALSCWWRVLGGSRGLSKWVNNGDN